MDQPQQPTPQPQPQQPAPQMPMQGQPMMQHPAVPAENPGQVLGIVGLVCNFIGVHIAGIVLGVMSRNKSKQVGMATTIGTVSLVWGIIGTVLVTLWVIFAVFLGIISIAAAPTTGSSTSTSTYSNDY